MTRKLFQRGARQITAVTVIATVAALVPLLAPQAASAIGAAPVVTGISPNSDATSFTEPVVTITGTGFTGATVVDFGATPALDPDVVSNTKITVTAPSHDLLGVVDVTVVTPAGTSATSSADRFTYDSAEAPGPVEGGIDPTTGPSIGGTTVAINGHGLADVTAVHFGATPARSFTVNSDTSITAISPGGDSAVSVTVTVGDTSSPSAATFTYSNIGAYAAVGPTRVLDTRTGVGVPGGKIAPVGPTGVVTFGLSNVPIGATGAVLNLTATHLTGALVSG